MNYAECVKQPVIKNENYIVYVEMVQGLTFIHMDVFKWNKSIKKEFVKTWKEWAGKHKPLYAMPFIDDEKMHKWSIITGFELLQYLKCLDGITRKLYIWR